jgi:predicted GIY-YIG superfamily endonuclease
MYTVYILYSSTTQKYYVGQTQNLENRLIEHNAGETKSLRTGMLVQYLQELIQYVQELIQYLQALVYACSSNFSLFRLKIVEI